MRKLSLVIAGILGAGTPLISQAATLGEARVQSNLTEPLEVEVPLVRSANEPLDEIKVQLAPPAFYEQAGVPLSSVPTNLIFNIESRGGRDYVVIRSRRAVRDPILSILLEVSSSEGRMIREYSLLLDPPGVGATADEDGAESTPRQEASAPRTARSTWERVDPATNVDLEDTYQVKRGDTLSAIASRYVTAGEDIRPLMQAIIDANPDAFVNGNGNALMAEAELNVPESPTDAEERAGETKPSAERGPALELLDPESEEGAEADEAESRAHADIAGLSREAPLPTIDSMSEAATERPSSLDLEELESVKAENEALTEQLESLTEQIDSVKLSIDERESRIADLQQEIEQARTENAELRELQGNFWIEWGKYLVGGLGLIVLALLIALGLRRGREEPEPAPQPAPSPDTGTTGATAAAAGGATMATAAADESMSEPEAEEETRNEQDPLDPRTALDEARMLESFNLTQQAADLLEDSLAEHPGHEGLQEALTRLRQGGSAEAGPETGEAGVEETLLDESEGTGDMLETPEATDTEGETPPTEYPLETPEREEGESLSLPEEETEGGAPGIEEPTETEEREESHPTAGTIDWDEDLDNVLATPETVSEAKPREGDADLMEFEDSYALETPVEDRERESGAGEEEEMELSLPDVDEPSDTATGSEEPSPTWSEREEPTEAPDELDLADFAEPEPEQEPSAASGEEPSDQGADEAVDTRVSLAEAFLDVGDQESFEMIESELQEEGATEALQRLEELKKRYE